MSDSAKVKELLKLCLYERLDKLNREFDRVKRSYDFSAKEESLYSQLIRALPEELKPLLIQYSDLLNEMMTEQQEFFYKKGFSDCHHFIRYTLE